MSGNANSEGFFALRRVFPGEYLLRVQDGEGSTWHEEKIVIGPGDSLLTVYLDLISVEGELRCGDTPLAGKLRFRGPTHARGVFATANDDGEFSAILPAEGIWLVDFIPTKAPESAWQLPPVEIKREGSASPQEITIALPRTRMKAVVRDSAGKKIAHAVVVALNLGDRRKERSLRSDEDGVADLSCMQPGRYAVQARTAEGGALESQFVEVDLAEDSESQEVVLVIEKLLDVGVSVSSAGSPIAGALVAFRSIQADQSRGSTRTVATDTSGLAKIRVPQGLVEVLIAAPGYGMALRLIQVGDSASAVQIGISPIGGSVETTGAESETSLDRLRLEHGGASFSLSEILLVMGSVGLKPAWNENRIVFSMCEPGAYRLCDFRGAETRCSQGQLQPWSELALPTAESHGP